MVVYINQRICARCGVKKPLNAENFPEKIQRRTRFRGICKKCWEKEHPPPPPEQTLHPAKLYWMCKRKQVFKTEQAAKNTAIKHALKHRGDKVGSYQCPACGKWHLTTHPRKQTGV